MFRYVVISIISGLLFGILDGVINANPLALKLFEYLKPLAKNSINIPAGLAIDLLYGFIMAGVFLLLYQSLPGGNGLVKGLSYAVLLWFFRVVMYAASQWMTLKVPALALIYILISGLVEMLILGLLYGLTLRPIVK